MRARSRIQTYSVNLAFLLTVAPTTLLAAPIGETAHSNTGWVAEQAPAYYRFRLGDFKVTVLSDGTAVRDPADILSKPEKTTQMFEAANMRRPLPISINCYLVDTGTHKILVDTGAGELFGASSGQLLENMAAAGYENTDIDTVLLTHIHGDHSGGLTVGGKRVFPNATVYVDERDADFWLSDENEANASADLKKTFQQSQQTVNPYVVSGQLTTFDGRQQLFEGVEVVPEHGHTPGMSGYLFESEGDKLLLWGDIVHVPLVQFQSPVVTVAYDVNADAAAATREDILSDAAREGYLVGGAHISFPGIGHISGDEPDYRWHPSPYNTILED